jgi:hypothetical protein
MSIRPVYTNAALICLNARESLKRGLQPSQESDNSRENAVRLSDVRHYGNYVGMKVSGRFAIVKVESINDVNTLFRTLT